MSLDRTAKELWGRLWRKRISWTFRELLVSMQKEVWNHPQYMQRANTAFWVFEWANRELAVRIKTKVTHGMRFCRVDAAKGLHLTRFAPKITCKVWTQKGCTKLKKSLGHVWYSSYSPSDRQDDCLLRSTKEKINMLHVKGISSRTQTGYDLADSYRDTPGIQFGKVERSLE